MLSAQWNELEDKSEYERQADEDKARHAREMNDYTPPPEEDEDDELEEDDAPKEDERPRREIANYGPVEAVGGGGKKSSSKVPAKWNDDDDEEEDGFFSASDLKAAVGKEVKFLDSDTIMHENQYAILKSVDSEHAELVLIDKEGYVVDGKLGDSIIHVDIAHITEVEEDPDSEQEEVELCEYEQMRAQRVARNAERLRALGLA